MNQRVIVLYSGTIQFCEERDLKLIGLSAIIFPYLAKFMKSNTTFLREIVIYFFSYLFTRGHVCD